MRLAYILDGRTFRPKDILEYTDYSFSEDIDYSNKSSITVPRAPAVEKSDFVICKNDNLIEFQGICESYTSSEKQTMYTVSLLQKENFFDRTILVEDEDSISGTGVEDFVKKTIESNWISSGDPLLDTDKITVTVSTHTPVYAKVSTTVNSNDGVYNLKTYLGNLKQYYGIYTDFDIKNGSLKITVRRKTDDPVCFNTSVSDISDYSETYDVDVLAKLIAMWKIPDTEDDNGKTIIGAETKRTFYLLADRTITENVSDENRASGTVESIRIETETEEGFLQSVKNEFSGNAYNHKISFSLRTETKLYDVAGLYIGRSCMVKTKTGIKTSIITQTSTSSDSGTKEIVLGTLPVTLIEKIRRS